MRQGYNAEYKCKKELIKIYSNNCVIKVAISQQGCDFLVFQKGILIKAIEVKSTHTKGKFRFGNRERHQIERIKEFGKEHNIIPEVWLYRYNGRGQPVSKEIILLEEKNAI